MFYTAIARVLAAIMLLFGIWLIAAGLAAAGDPEASLRYLGSANAGRHIDRGFSIIGLAVALGVLSEISSAVFRAAGTGTSKDGKG